MGCVEQKPVVDSSGKAQMQPVLHGWPAPQLPPQVTFLASLRNCRAESVPALRTAVSIIASKRFLMKFRFMSHLPFFDNSLVQTAACYFAAGTAPASFVVQNPVTGVVKEQTHLVVELIQGRVMLHVPPQVLVWKLMDNCRADSVPALRTRVTMIANKRVWIFFFMIVLLY